MIKIFKEFNIPFIYGEYMIFYYEKQRFDFKHILVYIEDEPDNNKGVYSAIGRRIISSNQNSNIRLTLKYNEDYKGVYTDVLSNELNLIWRGFDEKEAIQNIDMLNNIENYNL